MIEFIFLPYLKLTAKSNEVLLIFNKDFPQLTFFIKDYVEISIKDLNPEEYEYKFYNLKTTSGHLIRLNYTKKVIQKPFMILRFNLPVYLKKYSRFHLAKSEISLRLNSYFENENIETILLEKSSSRSEFLGTIARNIISITSLARPKSSFSFRGKFTLDMIQNLR